MTTTIAGLLALLLLVALPTSAETQSTSLGDLSPEERQRLEQRVEEMEQALAQARENALMQCRARLSTCSTKTCGKLPESRGAAWEKCQNDCETSYKSCQEKARAIWPDE